MAGAFGIVALAALFVAVLAGAALLMLGLYVVKHYPNPGDPARSAKRFTRPALALVIVIALAVIAIIVGIIGAGAAILTT